MAETRYLATRDNQRPCSFFKDISLASSSRVDQMTLICDTEARPRRDKPMRKELKENEESGVMINR